MASAEPPEDMRDLRETSSSALRESTTWVEGALVLIGCEAWERDNLQRLAARELIDLCTGAAQRQVLSGGASPYPCLRVAVDGAPAGDDGAYSLPQPNTPSCGVVVDGCSHMGYLPTKAASVKLCRWLESLDVGLTCHAVGGSHDIEPADPTPGHLDTHNVLPPRAQTSPPPPRTSPKLTTAHVSSLDRHEGSGDIVKWATETESPSMPTRAHARQKPPVPTCAASIMKRGIDGRLAFTDPVTVGVDVSVAALLAAAGALACRTAFDYVEPPLVQAAAAAVATALVHAAAFVGLTRKAPYRRSRTKPQTPMSYNDTASTQPETSDEKTFEHRLLVGTTSAHLHATKREAEILYHSLRMASRVEGRLRNEPNWQKSLDGDVLEPFSKRVRKPKVVRGQTVARLPGAQVTDPTKREQRELAREVRWQREERRYLVDQEKIFCSNATAMARLLPPIHGSPSRSKSPPPPEAAPLTRTASEAPSGHSMHRSTSRATATWQRNSIQWNPHMVDLAPLQCGQSDSSAPPYPLGGRGAPPQSISSPEQLPTGATYREIQEQRGWRSLAPTGAERHLDDRKAVLEHLLKEQAKTERAVHRRRRAAAKKEKVAFGHTLQLTQEAAERRSCRDCYDKSRPQAAYTLPEASPALDQQANYWDRYNHYVAAKNPGRKPRGLKDSGTHRPPDPDEQLRHTLLFRTSPLAREYNQADLAQLADP